MEPPELTIDVKIDGLPDLAQYFGVWAVEPMRFMAAFEQVRQLDIAAHVREARERGRTVRTTANREGTIALVELQGTLMKQASSLEEGASSVELRRQIRQAAQDPGVEGILIRIDSPGGTVAGTADLAREVAAAGKRKPVYAFIEDLGASAAYWVASQAGKVFANDATALIGSIGTFVGLYDLSKQVEMLGIKPIVINSGGVKGATFPGQEISEEVIEELQGLVNKVQDEFNRTIAKGRKLPLVEARKLADGRVHMAADAQALKLIDGIRTMDQVLGALTDEIDQGKRPALAAADTGGLMADKNDTQAAPQAATFDEIMASCEGATNDFICDQLKAKATAPEARAAWQKELLRVRDTQAQKIAALEKAQEDSARRAAKPGIEPLGTKAKEGGSASTGDAIAEWNEALAARVKAGVPRAKASSQLAREQPELRQAMVEAYNDLHTKSRKAS